MAALDVDFYIVKNVLWQVRKHFKLVLCRTTNLKELRGRLCVCGGRVVVVVELVFAEGLLHWDLSKQQVRFAHKPTEAQKSQEGLEIFGSGCWS